MSRNAKMRTISDEIVPLAQRMRYMQIFRLTLALGVVAFAAYAPEVVGAGPLTVARGAGAFLALALVAEAVSRALKGRGLWLFAAMLIVDGVFLAWLAYVTGGAASSLLNLILLHLAAVTLLASYRTGLKLAMWHSLLLLVVYYGQEANIAVPGMANAPVPAPEAFHRLVGFIGVYWVVALATSTFSAVNERELRRRRYDLEALAKMAVALEATSDPREIAKTLLDSLADTFGFRRGLVLAKVGDEVSPIGSKGNVAKSQRERFPAQDQSMRRAWESRRPVLLGQLKTPSDPVLAALLPDAKNVVIVPLTAEGGSVGLVVLEHGVRVGARIERRVVSMVERFCSHVALAMRNASLVEQLRDLAATDGLTGVANRRTFEAALELELDRASRSGSAVSLVMLDIDHFKQLNDTHGHRAGDQVLQGVAEALQQHCRSFDTPARYGGEEFAVILPGCDVADAVESAERFRRAVAAMVGPVSVTASAGVATFPVHAADGESLVKSADAAMYESKRNGRDRTTQAAPTVGDEGEAWMATEARSEEGAT